MGDGQHAIDWLDEEMHGGSNFTIGKSIYRSNGWEKSVPCSCADHIHGGMGHVLVWMRPKPIPGNLIGRKHNVVKVVPGPDGFDV